MKRLLILIILGLIISCTEMEENKPIPTNRVVAPTAEAQGKPQVGLAVAACYQAKGEVVTSLSVESGVITVGTGSGIYIYDVHDMIPSFGFIPKNREERQKVLTEHLSPVLRAYSDGVMVYYDDTITEPEWTDKDGVWTPSSIYPTFSTKGVDGCIEISVRKGFYQ